MLRIEMLPAAHGDCLWIEYGDPNKPSRVLVDGGTAPTYTPLRDKIAKLPPDERHFDLFIITHVDADHIEGSVRLLGDDNLGVKYDDVWFNGWKHLPSAAADRLGPVQGEMLSALIQKAKHPWNHAFEEGAAVVPNEGPLPSFELAGGLKVTLLSPTPAQLAKLAPKWKKAVEEAGLSPGVAKKALAQLAKTKKLQPDVLGGLPVNVETLAKEAFGADTAEPNGSSIGVLVEFDGKRILLGADAFAPVLAASVQRLIDDRGLERLPLSALKLPHHGSKANINPDLLKMLKCNRYLFSTNGAIFNHPDAEGVARVIKYGGKKIELLFNYRTEFNEVWDNDKLKDKYGYKATYAEGAKTGLAVEL